VGVFLERGCGSDLLINILLTVLGYIPGIIHALYVDTQIYAPDLWLIVVTGTLFSNTSRAS
jgi:Proteolipid membrane potential modulator